MKKYILILLMFFTTSVFSKITAQSEPYFNIVQVQPPQQVQQVYQNWIETNEFWLPHQQIGQWVASGVFWKVSGNDAKGYNYASNLNGSYIVPVYRYVSDNNGNITSTLSPYIAAIIISNDGRTVDFSHDFGNTSWFQYVKQAQQ